MYYILWEEVAHRCQRSSTIKIIVVLFLKRLIYQMKSFQKLIFKTMIISSNSNQFTCRAINKDICLNGNRTNGINISRNCDNKPRQI